MSLTSKKNRQFPQEKKKKKKIDNIFDLLKNYIGDGLIKLRLSLKDGLSLFYMNCSI